MRYLSLGVVALVAAISPMFGALVTTNIYVITSEDPVFEDQYVTSQSAVIDGVLDGDLTIFTGNLTISGEVTGSVQAMSSGTVTVTETGRIGGALRGVSVNTSISGEVGGDVFMTSGSIVLEEPGVVQGDLMAFGGVTRVEGLVERDVRGRTFRMVVTGDIGGDIDVATQRFEVGATAMIDGDVLYRSPADASISPEATVAGTVTRLPAQSNFVYGLILSLANLVGLLAFIVAGIVILLVARGTGSRATGAMITNPIRSLLYGIAAVVAAPMLIVILGATLVGLPIAVLIAALLVLSIIFGPVPAVTALGNRVLLRRGGLLGGFVLGALLWRLGIWLIPVFGGILYLLALVWGIGAWINGAIASRQNDPVPVALLPAVMVPAAGVPADWNPPYAPGFAPPVVDDGIDAAAPGIDPNDDAVEHDPVGTRDLTADVGAASGNSEPGEIAADDEQKPIGDDGGADADVTAVGEDESSAADDDDPSGDSWGLPRS